MAEAKRVTRSGRGAMLGVSVEAVWRVQQLLSYVDRRLRDLRVLELVRQRMWFLEQIQFRLLFRLA